MKSRTTATIVTTETLVKQLWPTPADPLVFQGRSNQVNVLPPGELPGIAFIKQQLNATVKPQPETAAEPLAVKRNRKRLTEAIKSINVKELTWSQLIQADTVTV